MQMTCRSMCRGDCRWLRKPCVRWRQIQRFGFYLGLRINHKKSNAVVRALGARPQQVAGFTVVDRFRHLGLCLGNCTAKQAFACTNHSQGEGQGNLLKNIGPG